MMISVFIREENMFSFSYNVFKKLFSKGPHPGGSVVSVSDSWPGGCEFDPRIFSPLTSAEACEKSSRWL